MSYPTTPTSPKLDDLYAQRAAIDAQIARKKRKIAPPKPAEDLSELYGANFVRDVGESVLKKIPVVESFSEFEENPSFVMARGIDTTSADRAPFLAFRIELLTQEQERVCVVTAKVFQSLYTGDDTQYISPPFVAGDDGNHYPSPLLIKKETQERRETIRDLIEGRKFVWDAIAHRPDRDAEKMYTPISKKPKAHYFRILGGAQSAKV